MIHTDSISKGGCPFGCRISLVVSDMNNSLGFVRSLLNGEHHLPNLVQPIPNLIFVLDLPRGNFLWHYGKEFLHVLGLQPADDEPVDGKRLCDNMEEIANRLVTRVIS